MQVRWAFSLKRDIFQMLQKQNCHQKNIDHQFYYFVFCSAYLVFSYIIFLEISQ